jgi:hypothetical protein
MPEIKKGTTSITRYVMAVDSSDGSPETGATITNFDLQYTRYGAAPAAKVDATELAATNSVWDDNKMKEIDGASSPGLYRVDWPNAAFAAGAEGVLLSVTHTGFHPAVEDIALVDNVIGDALDGSDRVDVGTWIGTAVTLGNGAPDVNIASTDDIDLSATQKASVNTEADTAMTTYGLDHLLQASVTGTDVADNSIIAKLVSKESTADWDDFVNTTDSLQAIRDDLTPHRILSGTATASSTASKVYVQSGDTPTGGADDDYNDTRIIVWRGTSKATARVNVRAVIDYDDSDPSFTLDVDLGFTPQANDLVEVYAADSAALASLSKLTVGFGTSVPDTLEAYLRAIMSKGASAPANAGTFDPATDSLEYLGERQALIEGAGFATGTDSLKQIRDAIDTLVAPAVVGASALSGSGFLSDCVTLVRRMTDEPSLIPKYTDADVVEHVTSAMTVVMSEIHNNSDHNILCRFDIQLVSGQQTYIIPPNVGEIWNVRKMSTTTPVRPVYEVWADNHWSSHQSGFVIEHNEFRLLTDWRSTDILEILYVPNGEAYMHKGTAQSATAGTITLATAVTDGTMDTRANAYAGYLCRVLSDTTKYVQERIIDSYVNTTKVATLTTDWSPTPTGTIVYEVLPTYSNIIKHAVCMQAAMDILGNEGNSKRMQLIERRYLVKIRALRQMITKKSSRFGGHMLGDTSDNDDRGGFYGWLV